MSTNAQDQLVGGQQAVRFHNSLLGMNPPGLDRIEPGTFSRQKKGQNAYPFALLLDLAVVLSDPGPHQFAVMPGSIIPDQQPRGLALLLQPATDPFQKLGGDGADRATGDEAKRGHLPNGIISLALLPEDPITGKGFGVRIILLPGLFDQVGWLILALPGTQRRQGKATPPHLIQKADGPTRLSARPSNQPIAGVFFSRYWGSGLVIQCLARFQLFPNLLRARRTLSPEIRRGVSPCWKLILATKGNVHTLVVRPKSEGRRCKRSCNASSASSGKVVRRRWGREEPSCKTQSACALKPWITLSTVCLWHPNCLAMAGGRSPRSEASKI